MCSDLMHQIFELFPTVLFGVHVDDLSYSAEGGDQEEVVELLGQVHMKVQEGMRDQSMFWPKKGSR